MPPAQTGARADSRPDRHPAGPGEPSSGDPPTVEIRPPQRGTEVVLVVDDERGVRTVAGHILQSFGYTVLEARGAEDAIRRASNYPGRIHLLLTDVALARECGRALAAALTVLQPGLKVLFMSGRSHPAAAIDPTKLLSKPFAAAELAARVRRALDAA